MAGLDGARVALLVAHEFEDIELLYPIVRLSEEGANVVVGTLPQSAPAHFHTRPWLADKPITGRFGSTVPILVLAEGRRYTHRPIPELRPDDFDCLIFPGGFSPDYLRIDPTTLRLAADAHRGGKVVAAICHGPQVLISVDRRCGTNIVRGRRVTGYAAVEDDLRNAGGEYADVPAMRDGNVVTGRCPDDLPEFCQEVARAVQELRGAGASVGGAGRRS
ncbi:MAG TPA: DJ-1/PfpI family protein [Chloroflexota bacterium]|jgi:protease I